jgi:spore coat protein U-like protein
MPMMLRSLFLTVMLAVCATLPQPARAALICAVDIVSLDFGTISVRDGLLLQTSGPVTIDCSGGTPGTTIQACVSLGSGSGGSGPGQSPRYMTGDGTAPLAYQLTALNSFSGGGSVWETVGYAIALDATGSATIAATLHAEMTTIAAQATVGTYSSRFDGGADVTLSYARPGAIKRVPQARSVFQRRLLQAVPSAYRAWISASSTRPSWHPSTRRPPSTCRAPMRRDTPSVSAKGFNLWTVGQQDGAWPMARTCWPTGFIKTRRARRLGVLRRQQWLRAQARAEISH